MEDFNTFVLKATTFIRSTAWHFLVKRTEDKMYHLGFCHFSIQSSCDLQDTKDPAQDSQYTEYEVDVMRAQKKQVCDCSPIAVHSQMFQNHQHC